MKSGTTWLCRTINAHPNAFCHQESHLAEWLWPALDRAFTEFDERLHRNGYNVHTGLTPDDAAMFRRLAMDRQLVRYLRGSRRYGDMTLRVLGDKTPMHALHMDALAAAYPSAKFVCCERDPRDAAVSAWKHLHEMLGHRPNDTFEAYAQHYVKELWARPTLAGRKAKEVLGNDRVFTIPYERHKVEPHAAVRDLFSFLKLDVNDALLAQIVDSQRFERVAGRPAGVEARDRDRKGIVGDWVNHMTTEFANSLLRLAEESLGEWKEPPRSTREGSGESVKSHAAA
jgi:hypothetical protein